MAKVRITTPEGLPWQVATERQRDPRADAILADGGKASAYKIREPGSETRPQLVELRFFPGEVVELHSHDEAEILYILSGEMRLGSRTIGAGASVFIDGGVFYGFTAGPDGLHFLNFRAHVDTSFHTPEKRLYVDTSVAA